MFSPESGTQHTLKKQGKLPWGKLPAFIPAIILDISGRDATARGHLGVRRPELSAPNEAPRFTTQAGPAT
jgi:hypothetical protein